MHFIELLIVAGCFIRGKNIFCLGTVSYTHLAYIRELQAVSRNINQIAKRANTTGTVYRQDIEDIKKAVDEIWRLQRRTLLNQP